MADYFSQDRRRGSTSNSDRLNAPLPTGGRPGRPAELRESFRPPSSIRIRRIPSSTPQQSRPVSQASDEGGLDAADFAGRRRSMSAPQRYQPDSGQQHGESLARQRTVDHAPMGTITEHRQLQQAQAMPLYEASETPQPQPPSVDIRAPPEAPVECIASGTDALQSAGDVARRSRGLRRFRSGIVGDRSDHHDRHDEYDSGVVNLLDLVDPEVRTIGTLTNVQNSLFIPDLGGLINRRPAYELTPRTTDLESRSQSRVGPRARERPPAGRMRTIKQKPTGATPGIEMQSPRRERIASISSQLSDSHYAVLPHGVDLEGWSEGEIDELNDHVRHLLHSRKEGFKRGWRGFRKYLSKPLGLFVFVYATLVTLFGAAWVFCLIGWIYVGSEQDYFINVIDNILVALFAVMGDGLAPFRTVDTYHMCFIAHYHRLTWRLRNEKKLPNLVDENDLPDRRVNNAELEYVVDKQESVEISVLSPRQQKRLQYHQAKFSKAHTFYKPHETATHHAFPLRLLVAVVVLLDCHSLFQVALGTITWSINYRVRPQALTASILSCSIICNIMAGVLISIGDHRTRKKDVLERIFRQDLTEEAIRHVQRNHTMSRPPAMPT